MAQENRKSKTGSGKLYIDTFTGTLPEISTITTAEKDSDIFKVGQPWNINRLITRQRTISDT